MGAESDAVNGDAEIVRQVIVREKNSREMELYLWGFASVGVLGGVFIDLLIGRDPGQVMSQRYSDFMIALMVLFFPVLFRLIFNAYPVELLRRKRLLIDSLGTPEVSKASVAASKIRSAEVTALSEVIERGDHANFSASELFSYYASTSRNLAQNLYGRSGVYLLVGVFVAFSGLAFFYMETLSSTAYKGMELVIVLAPKFGILFFIELVAFFFLRQYRSAMDEFRYYEAVKRKREETLALIQLTFEGGKGAEVLELVKNGCFFSEGKFLGKDQTTEIIESRKLEKSELEVLEKIIEVVSGSKK